MTGAPTRPGGGPRRRLSPAWVAPLSWVGGAYFLGAIFLSIAHQLFCAPPPPTDPPSPYRRAWCIAQFAGLRTELETQARGALAGAAFAAPKGGEAGGWYPAWGAWHARVVAACPAPADGALALGLADLADLGARLAGLCAEVQGPARARLEAIDARLGEVRAGGS